jgi:hypothetical protein
MPAIKPDAPRKERTSTALREAGDDKKAAIAEAARRAAAQRLEGGSPGVVSTSSSEAAALAASLGSPGFFATLREQLGMWWWVILGGSVVVGIVFLAARGVIAGVDAAQKDMSQHVEREEVVLENAEWGMQRTKLNEATDALAKGSFVTCTLAAQQALAGQKTAKLVIDAKWLLAQCSLLARDASAAEDALQDFKDNANISDARYELAKAQLKALARGELPGGLRSW